MTSGRWRRGWSRRARRSRPATRPARRRRRRLRRSSLAATRRHPRRPRPAWHPPRRLDPDRRRAAVRRRLATWCSATGPLLRHRRHLPRVRGRRVPRRSGDRSVHSESGGEAIARVAQLEMAERPFLAVLHMWDVHMPRRYPASFDPRGTDAMPMSARSRALTRGSGRALAGGRLDGCRLHGRPRREHPARAAYLRTRAPGGRSVACRSSRWAQWALTRGARSDSKRLLRLAPRHLWGHGQTLLEPLVRVPLVVSRPRASCPGPGGRR